MIVGLLHARRRRLTAWVPSVHSRAVFAQRTGRRLTRWLATERLEVPALDGPLLPRALAEWGHQLVYLALETSTLWHTDGVGRLSRVYRGRAIPIVWTVLDHPRSRVGYAVYPERREKGAAWLPGGGPVVLTAERGCADPPRMDHLVP
jgi:hypothetical protein